jgi:hypothetical protein
LCSWLPRDPARLATNRQGIEQQAGGQASTNTLTGTESQVEEWLQPKTVKYKRMSPFTAALSGDKVLRNRWLDEHRAERHDAGGKAIEHNRFARLCGTEDDTDEVSELWSSEASEQHGRVVKAITVFGSSSTHCSLDDLTFTGEHCGV